MSPFSFAFKLATPFLLELDLLVSLNLAKIELVSNLVFQKFDSGWILSALFSDGLTAAP
jgi:hypothetical protein